MLTFYDLNYILPTAGRTHSMYVKLFTIKKNIFTFKNKIIYQASCLDRTLSFNIGLGKGNIYTALKYRYAKELLNSIF